MPRAASTHKVTWSYNHVVLRVHATNWKHISTTTMPLAIKLGKMLTCLEWLLPNKSHEHNTTCSCKVTRKIRSVVSLQPQGLWPTNWQGDDLLWEYSTNKVKKTFWKHGHVRSHDKLKTYLHYSNVYVHQNRAA